HIPLPSSAPLGAAPESALSPYTTLFRSLGEDEADDDDDIPAVTDDQETIEEPDEEEVDEEIPENEIVIDEDDDEDEDFEEDEDEDRKSTRLNSSHVSISYAVFCLKKKIR